MGVTGAGKTTVGRLLAQKLGWQFADADSFHSPASVAKMQQGIALDDADRQPWLSALRTAISGWIADHRDTVLACSALKRSYRVLLGVTPEVRYVYLKASPSQIEKRLGHRHGHFATAALLCSQFATLEEPKDALTLDATRPSATLVAEICQWIAPGTPANPPTSGTD
jgi:gluconokinase